MSIFIEIEVESDKIGPELAQQIASLCPVDIFTMEEQRLAVRTSEEDECTLCELCLDIAPDNTLTIRKLYKNEKLISRGGRP